MGKVLIRTCTRHKCRTIQVLSSTKPKQIYPKYESHNKSTHWYPPKSSETRGHPVAFLVPMLVQ